MIELFRFCSESTVGTFGRLTYEDFCCYTVERPWRNNKQMESCIPAGTYPVSRSFYHRGRYEVWEIAGVPNRSRILIHRANEPSEVSGCVGVGLSLGVVNDCWAVRDSRKAFDAFMEATDILEPRHIRIVDPINGG